MPQVESLSSMMEKVEALVVKAEQASTLLQSEYHQDKFRVFPHVNSPAWLIRHLIKPGDGSDGSAAEAQHQQQ